MAERINFRYNESSVVGDVFELVELLTGRDMYEYELYAEYPIDPRNAYPTSASDFKAYDAMPPCDLETNFVQVIREAQGMAARQLENSEVAHMLRQEANMDLIHINISHRNAAFRRY
ncbi:hypothetical protein IW150_001802 [Coemansia sp. RSA 2607]|nr:hypothetical protein IW150_001802 [Coemansia sp. RSA 2607]KAJ2397019.1 hypothetical protein GGI05_000850 [Coemansia sp. RSA 2603]